MDAPPLHANLIPAARGTEPADLVLKNAMLFDAFSCSWEEGDLAIKDGIIVGTGRSYRGIRERDLGGALVVPGLIDAHVHIESSLLVPQEYAHLVAAHGTTTVIADPHEIANIAGKEGIEYMLACRAGLPVDILYMLPSCVPATPADVGGAVLDAGDLAGFPGRDGILGLGEMMNVPGVLGGDPGVLAKLVLSRIRDGHAPHLSGPDLNAYLLSGPDSDHECTTASEAKEKLRCGMYLFVREGSTEKNIAALVPVVTPYTVSRCSFCTDDCHADLLAHSGHIDRCIRTAVAGGLEPELALRMATLSPAERFSLPDRGALAPGRRADFCIVDDPRHFAVKETYSRGRPVAEYAAPQARPPVFAALRCTVPSRDQIRLFGTGRARVIGLVPGQILTESLTFDLDAAALPDISRDLLKLVVCNRYGKGSVGTGIVHGFGFKDGAIAASISHDAHNIVAAGTGDEVILSALTAVIRAGGGMAAVHKKDVTVLPLDCAGLMSTHPAREVIAGLDALSAATRRIGGIDDPFMYLSFLALTVIPALRLTDRGLFDAVAFRDVPVFP
ncbi:adenine deaminase [Methanoregula boonei 6A8]|uniref:Adenine deaminase n=1 Tax=Methanoregula boonei (strain DSM 21154 / JCM 14090 / 6A8) TaxID=456442 RepID=ADEC_METB6|nr:adenine deaminase [Methanoregula boonei]A7I8N1.1 RecName: Full=Adenine deaminase; Short=Adenase; Short=Adenine aminase [Methanoregula boonei 6A8]ABS56092.1 adenine deaminase [Methanoregula boonei 6A8]